MLLADAGSGHQRDDELESVAFPALDPSPDHARACSPNLGIDARRDRLVRSTLRHIARGAVAINDLDSPGALGLTPAAMGPGAAT